MAKASKKPGPENVEVSAPKVEAPAAAVVKAPIVRKHSDADLAKHPKFAKFNSHGGK